METLLAVLRRERGVTQSELAEASGIPQPVLSAIENGLGERMGTVAYELGYRGDPMDLLMRIGEEVPA